VLKPAEFTNLSLDIRDEKIFQETILRFGRLGQGLLDLDKSSLKK
jgi:hypothetical protein